jgi:hypothetical protein
MSTLEILQVTAVAVLVVSVAETFRERPWWPRSPVRPPERGPGRGTSPRERRWLHGGLALLLAGNVMSLRLDEEATGWWGLALGLMLAGLVAVGVGFVRGPTERERRRYAEEFGGPDAPSASS